MAEINEKLKINASFDMYFMRSKLFLSLGYSIYLFNILIIGMKNKTQVSHKYSILYIM